MVFIFENHQADHENQLKTSIWLVIEATADCDLFDQPATLKFIPIDTTYIRCVVTSKKASISCRFEKLTFTLKLSVKSTSVTVTGGISAMQIFAPQPKYLNHYRS